MNEPTHEVVWTTGDRVRAGCYSVVALFACGGCFFVIIAVGALAVVGAALPFLPDWVISWVIMPVVAVITVGLIIGVAAGRVEDEIRNRGGIRPIHVHGVDSEGNVTCPDPDNCPEPNGVSGA